ncbi:MAG: 3-deoxy-8-phosphooctulonate synthase [Candidatus Omnitrophica bacterium]|nr:3-deoxy-8-phosphooctulonate synthase [Candidatus Omnitrophota bacterium]
MNKRKIKTFSSWNDEEQFFLIAGPCVIESEKICARIAAALKDICGALNMPLIFKASYDKANRTSVNSFRGPGLTRGLAILSRIKRKFDLPVLSDIHHPAEAHQAKAVLDVLQIPALLCRQTDLLTAAAKTGRIVNVKKGQFLSPQDMVHAVKKIEASGNTRIMLTERGSSFGYHNLVVDMRSIPLMKSSTGYPVVFDATHSVQLPGAGAGKSAGERIFAEPLALSAVAAGCDGLFLEVHENPDAALCDGPNMVSLADLPGLLRKAQKIREALYA